MKKSTIVASCFFLAAVSLALYSSVANDEGDNPSPVDEPTAKLIKRIDKLENRIGELEAMVQQAQRTVQCLTKNNPANSVPQNPISNSTPKNPKVVPDNSFPPTELRVFYTDGELLGGEWLIPNEGVEFDVLDGIAMTKGNRFNKSTPNEILASYSIIRQLTQSANHFVAYVPVNSSNNHNLQS